MCLVFNSVLILLCRLVWLEKFSSGMFNLWKYFVLLFRVSWLFIVTSILLLSFIVFFFVCKFVIVFDFFLIVFLENSILFLCFVFRYLLENFMDFLRISGLILGVKSCAFVWKLKLRIFNLDFFLVVMEVVIFVLFIKVVIFWILVFVFNVKRGDWIFKMLYSLLKVGISIVCEMWGSWNFGMWRLEIWIFLRLRFGIMNFGIVIFGKWKFGRVSLVRMVFIFSRFFRYIFGIGYCSLLFNIWLMVLMIFVFIFFKLIVKEGIWKVWRIVNFGVENLDGIFIFFNFLKFIWIDGIFKFVRGIMKLGVWNVVFWRVWRLILKVGMVSKVVWMSGIVNFCFINVFRFLV